MEQRGFERQMNIWLEISECADIVPKIVLDHNKVREISVLSEALAAAQKVNSAKQTSGTWDYSSRISQEESDRIRNAIEFAKASEDKRSMIFSTDVSYSHRCYSLRLFFEKSQ